MKDDLLLEAVTFFISQSNIDGKIFRTIKDGREEDVHISKEYVGDILRRRYTQLLQKEQKLEEYNAIIRASQKGVTDVCRPERFLS